jgi:hypothetical protein
MGGALTLKPSRLLAVRDGWAVFLGLNRRVSCRFGKMWVVRATPDNNEPPRSRRKRLESRLGK